MARLKEFEISIPDEVIYRYIINGDCVDLKIMGEDLKKKPDNFVVSVKLDEKTFIRLMNIDPNIIVKELESLTG